MELNKLREFLLDSKSTEFTAIIQVIDEINIVIQKDVSKFNLHRALREKLFILVQLIVETNNELLIKFILNTLKIYLLEEIKCDFCPLKEKSQFLLNILRYIHQAFFQSEHTKLEIFKFLISNHETIEPYLTSKIFDCLLNISIAEFESENEFLKSSCKALIIKYIAVVCNETKKKINFKENSDEYLTFFDSFLVDIFEILLEIFNQEFRSFEIRNLIAECIEQILCNLISERKSLNGIRKNELFIEFAWKKFCPAILCQFGTCSILNKSIENQGLNLKQIYTILIQLTSLIGGNKIMIPVFEAIYQRVLMFSPDQDNQLILRLFKSYVTKDFVLSLLASKGADNSEPSIRDLSLINLIIGFYRNCFEQSNKHPNDKALKFLSFECIHSFIKIVNELYEDSLREEIFERKNFTQNLKLDCSLDDKNVSIINKLSDQYVNEILDFSTQLAGEKYLNLAQEIKKFCVNFIENAKENFLKKNSFKFLIATYMSIYYIANKSKCGLGPSNLINRIFVYDECDFTEEIDNQIYLFRKWLEKIFFKMTPNSLVISTENKKQIDLLIKQTDCLASIGEEQNLNQPREKSLDLVKNILKCCWTYLVDVLMSFLENSNFSIIETTLFNQSMEKIISEDASNDITYLNFSIKSTLDSLYKLIKMLTSIESMDKELEQIFFILIESNFYKNSLLKYTEELSLNKIICLDFVFFTTTDLLLDNRNSSISRTASAEKILWKYMIESLLFCLSLQANLEYTEACVATNSYKENFTKYILAKKQKLFSSVYSNLNEVNDSPNLNRTKSLDLSDRCQLNDQIVQSVFYFLKKSKLNISIKMDRLELLDCLANKAYDCVFNKLFIKLFENDESYFEHVWKLCFNMCQLSKRFLTEEPNLRLQLEYFSFNFLIIDKLEDLLTRLMASGDLFLFFTDIWLNVYLPFFDKVFSKCGSMRNFSIQSDKSSQKFKKQNSFDKKFCPIIDFSIFKKIISMIQNLFEMHNSTGKDFFQYKNRCVSLGKNLITTPSMSPSTPTSSPIPITHDFNDPFQLLQKLEMYKNELNKRSKGDIVSKIFYSNTISLLSESSDKIYTEICSIDQIYNLNSILLIPYKRLMVKRCLEPNLKDTILTSVCELVERNSFKIANCWTLIFYCLSRINLNEQIDKSFTKNFNQEKSDSSVYSSDDENGQKSSESISSCSDRCFSKASLILPSVSFRFESYRIRLNSLKEVFNVFLNLAQESEYIMSSGAFDFLKCVSNYLQYKTSISNELSDQIVVHKTKENGLNEENISSDEDNEDLFLSANDYSIQERHYHFTSNYDHLCELSNASHSNTQNKAFIKCIEKMFDTVLKYKQSSSENLKFEIRFENFQFSIVENKTENHFKHLENFLTNEEINDLINFEYQDQIDRLNLDFKNFFQHDSKNYSKILIYLFKNLATRILMAHDEINSVQIVQLIFDLASKLVQKNELETLGYVILNVLFTEINFQIDLCELKNVKINSIESKFNPKLLVNSFFISNLVSKMIEKIIILCTSLIKVSKWDSFQKLIIYSITDRIFYLISKCLMKKLTDFDSFPEANYIHYLKFLYEACINSGDSNLLTICQSSIRILHAISLIPFENLCLAQNSEQNSDNADFFNMEVLTQKCRTAWELHNVKKAFQYAKYLLNSDTLKFDQNFDERENITEEPENEDDTLVNTNDDKNFFRDFTLKFSTTRSSNRSKIFQNLEDLKQINLTCFINNFKFHFDFLNLFQFLSLGANEIFLYESIKCLTLTYLVSIRLEQNLSLKILLSKIFYLNYENCLANFSILTKKSFSIINFLYFKKNLIKLELDLQPSLQKFNYDSLCELNDSEKLKTLIKNDPKKIFFQLYFNTFISQINNLYRCLFESSHEIKIASGTFESFLDKFENQNLSDYSEDTLNQKIEILMEEFREKNKFCIESYQTEKNDNAEQNYLGKNARNLFKVWSQEILPHLFLCLSKEVSVEASELYLVDLINFYSSQNNIKTNLVKNLVELILLFNNCSAFCKCSANIENEFSFFKIDLNTFKSITYKLMSILAILVSKK